MLKKSSSLSSETALPRVGVPWRTEKQERAHDLRYNQDYLDSVRKAGGEPVQISLLSPRAKLAQVAKTLDAFVLPGSPADVDPKLYGAPTHARTARPDPKREQTDFALLKHALATGKPVLATCYGVQSLNVYLGGSLYQDIPSQRRHALRHTRGSDPRDAMHEVRVTGGRLATVAGRPLITVNSTHHQSIRNPGAGLRVTAKAPDGVVEALEWTRGPGWVVGVQWHPERMPQDPVAQKLFRRLVSEAIVARNARLAHGQRPSRPKRRTTRAAAKTIHRKRKSGRRK
jgi:putative glutamine amidotransferase